MPSLILTCKVGRELDLYRKTTDFKQTHKKYLNGFKSQLLAGHSISQFLVIIESPSFFFTIIQLLHLARNPV